MDQHNTNNVDITITGNNFYINGQQVTILKDFDLSLPSTDTVPTITVTIPYHTLTIHP